MQLSLESTNLVKILDCCNYDHRYFTIVKIKNAYILLKKGLF